MNEADYDSDDYDTEGEDLYNVDFTDNFWQQRSDTQAIVNDADDNEDDAEEEGPVDYFQGQIHRLQDFANFLEHCNDFEFVELSADETAEMPPPPKVCDGDHGLQRGVADSFRTPF